MDARIDLTENRDFRKHLGFEDIPGWLPYKSIHPFTNFSIGVEKTLHKDQEEYLPDKWGIFQGNALTRQVKRYNAEFCDFITCDCCGKKLYPYYNDGLCPQCRDRINYKIPDWRNING